VKSTRKRNYNQKIFYEKESIFNNN
jgi:hypothetical protein